MNFPIPQFALPVEYFCVWGNAFTPEECDTIIDMCELLEFEKGRVGGPKPEDVVPINGELHSDTRDSDITWLNPTHENDWVHKRFASLISRINHDKFQVDLDGFDGFQYSKYSLDQHYDWHTDPIQNPPNPEMHRKISATLMLTDPKDYEGGELLLAPHGNNAKPLSIKRERGDLVVFYSFVPHRVTPVTAGDRISLVTWAMGPKFR